MQHNDERAPPVAPGEILAGKYRVERVLGAGGMGVVVAAHHLQLDQMVALKFILSSATSDPSATERFLREARLAAKLKSEHIAKVLDVGTLESGAPYMVMEYLDGQTLAEIVQRQGMLGVEMAAGLIAQACAALTEAHAIGIVHRDLKPQNLFVAKGVGGEPVVKVLDFGISKLIEKRATGPALTQTATIMGSPLYMAPEQMRSSRDVDARADIWALGVVMYELLTGRVPFEGESMTDLAFKIVQDPFVSVDQLRPEVPAALAAVVSQCLCKDREGRFADAAQLANALEPFLPAGAMMSVHRARMISNAFQRTLGAPSGMSALTPRGSSGPQWPIGTPVPWSGTGPAQTQSSANKKVVASILLVVGVAIAAGGVLAWRVSARGGPENAAAGAQNTSPGLTPAPALTATPPSPPPPIAAIVAPAAVPAPPAVPIASEASAPVPPAPPVTGAPVPSPRPAPRSAGRPAPAPAPAPAPPATSHPSANRDDDIPSLR